MNRIYPNIVLTGFMGTGKSSAGQMLALRLDRPFVDMDQILEERFAKPIPAVFAQAGEAVFRAAESRLCRELAAQHSLVIATGGGALVDPANHQTMARTGRVICLTASVDTILQRAGGDPNRPLLWDDAGQATDRRRKVVELLANRRQAYESIPLRLDTTGLSLDETVAQILTLLAGDEPP